MKKGLRVAISVFFAIPAILFVIYVLLGFYYIDGFPCFTWINGVYCTGKSVEQVNSELLSKTEYEGLCLIDKSGARLFVDAWDSGFKIDYTPILSDVYNDSNPFAWGKYIFKNARHEYKPCISLDRGRFEEIVGGWEIFVEPSEINYEIEYDPLRGYVMNNSYDTLPDKDAIIDLGYRSMMEMEAVKDLNEFPECYKEVTLNENDKRIKALYQKISEKQGFDITFRFDTEEVKLDSRVASKWLLTKSGLSSAREEEKDKDNPGMGVFIIGNSEGELPEDEDLSVVDGLVSDKDGNLIVCESKVYEYLSELADSHDTKWMMDRYRNGESSKVILKDTSKGAGRLYDISDEFENIKDHLLQNSVNEQLTVDLPLYENIITCDAASELGDNYIEVNMKDQELKYYVDGAVNMEMPVVTGNVNRGRGTPSGVFKIYNKRYHTNLIGVDYVSYVNYWLGVHKGVGIHDATWRSKFGEKIYRSDGSHGCINCPLDSVEKLWEVVETGTPVILYY
ncbi:MAG: L,D-transpeptidase [Butyrivibrio sp.]|nr:L,D-transpeptidase [Butyrivibrio sp.]